MKKRFSYILAIITAILFSNVSLKGQAGCIPYRVNSYSMTCLPIGSNGKVLTVVSGLPSWQTPGGGSGWSLTGNTGTSPYTNFIGTTDLTSLAFRINNERSGLISIDSGRCFFGYQAGKSNTTADDNTYFGWGAGMTNQTSPGNTGIGVKSLLVNIGGYNTGCGAGTLESLTVGEDNTAGGAYSQLNMVDGNGNTSYGRFSLANLPHGSYNVAIGWRALYGANTAQSENTAVGGFGVLFSNHTGSFNTAFGSQAGFSNDGSRNLFLGYKAGYNQTASSDLGIIDNQDRGSAANELTGAPIVLNFNASTASQKVTINAAHINISVSLSVTYADNAAALAGGLVAGDIYVQTGTYQLFVVH